MTTHPESDVGMLERKERGVFVKYLEILDDCIDVDGSVSLEDGNVVSGSGGNGGNSGSGSNVDEIMEALNGVWNYCHHGHAHDSGHPCELETQKVQSKDATDTVEHAHEHEHKKENTKSSSSNSIDNDKNEDTISSSTKTVTKAWNKYEKSLPYLTLLHSSQSIFTFMSLLGVIPTTTAAATDATDANNTKAKPTEEQMRILNKTTSVLTSILTPRKSSEREIKTLIKNNFVAMERLLLLISKFVGLTQAQEEQNSGTNTSASTGNGNADTDTNNDTDNNVSQYADTLKNLVQLATSACRNSERNKVGFVRAFKNSNQNPSKRSTIGLLVRCLSVVFDCHKNIIERSSECESVSESEGSSASTMVQLMTECCKLIAILCRYDDFRPDTSKGAGLGVDSSYGMNVSSSHDHVLEFNREGVVPVLYDITLIALTSSTKPCTTTSTDIVSEDDIVSLASAAMSATRVLAVNDDIVQALVAVGVLKVIKLALEMGVKEVQESELSLSSQDPKKLDQIKMHRQNLTSGAVGLIRNLCGNDGIKTSLCLGTNPSDPSTSSLHAILEGMRLYRDNATIQEHGCGTFAAMALRRPANAMRIVNENGPKEIIAALSKFPNNVLVQRQGALAVRNIVSRLLKTSTATEEELADANANNNGTLNDVEGKDVAVEVSKANTADDNKITSKDQKDTFNVRDVFLDLGAEVVLRHITGRHQGSVDEAYAALRDLGCEVSMTKFDEATQTFTRKVEMFGEVKSNFRPVYDEGADDMQDKMDACGI